MPPVQKHGESLVLGLQLAVDATTPFSLKQYNTATNQLLLKKIAAQPTSRYNQTLTIYENKMKSINATILFPSYLYIFMARFGMRIHHALRSWSVTIKINH